MKCVRITIKAPAPQPSLAQFVMRTTVIRVEDHKAHEMIEATKSGKGELVSASYSTKSAWKAAGRAYSMKDADWKVSTI